LHEHGNSLYTQLVHVPFIVMYPERVPAGVRVAEPVSLANLAATILDIVPGARKQVVPGRSLAPFWSQSGSRPRPEAVYSELDVLITEWHTVLQMRSVVDEGYHFIV